MIYFTEIVNKEICDFLLKLDNGTFKDLVFDPFEYQDEDNNKYNKESYIKNVKKYLNILKKHNYCKKVFYKSKNDGRQYSTSFSLQNLQSKIRGALLNNINYDYDMCNAFIGCILWITKIYLPHDKFLYIEQYYKNRDSILKQYSLNKMDFYKCSFSQNKVKTNIQFLKNYDNEIKQIQNKLNHLEIYSKLNIFSDSKTNQQGSLFGQLVFIKENELLNRIITYCKNNNHNIQTLMYDGLTVTNDGLSEKFNELCEDANITWKIKPHSTEIKIDESLIEEDEIYNLMKSDFEKEHFLVKNPLLYCREYEINNMVMLGLFDKFKFKDATAIYKLENEKGKKEHIIERWLEDPKMRYYESMDFLPFPRDTDPKIYNTFKGLRGEKIEQTADGDITNLLNHINILVGEDKNSFDYMINYLAHLIQFPGELPCVAIVFKSEQGVGKNKFFEAFANKLLGIDYNMTTTKQDDVIGRFNLIDKKLMIFLDETNGKDSFTNSEKIKGIITQETVMWEQKGIQAVRIQNCGRYIFFTNNNCPVKIELTDRRFVMFESTCKHIKDVETKNKYFKQLFNDLADNNIMKTLYLHLKNKDLTNFDINDRPITDVYNDLKKSQTPLIVNYLLEKVYKYDGKDNFIKDYISSKLFENYNHYLIKNGFSGTNQTSFGRLLNEYQNFGITKKRTTKGNKYTINYNLLKTHLKSKGYYEEIDFIDE